MNKPPWDHTAGMWDAQTDLKTSHLWWSYNYFNCQDCNTLSLPHVRNTKLLRISSALLKTGQQQCDPKKHATERILMADVLQQGKYKAFCIFTHLPTASFCGEWKRMRTVILLSNLDGSSHFTGILIVFSAIKRNESQGELWIHHAPSNVQCPVLPLKSSRCTVCIN